MRFTTAITATSVATALVLAGASLAHAQQAPATSFAALSKRLAIGETVVVTDLTGHTVKGKIEAVSDTTLVLRSDGRALQLATPTVQRVARLQSSVWLGAAVGAGAGFAFGVLQLRRGHLGGGWAPGCLRGRGRSTCRRLLPTRTGRVHQTRTTSAADSGHAVAGPKRWRPSGSDPLLIEEDDQSSRPRVLATHKPMVITAAHPRTA
jgi:hypothetical protein